MDWNNDGKKDLIVGEGDGHVRVYLNTNTDADPKFSGFSYVKAGGVSYVGSDCASPCVTDWDEDGRKDLLVGDDSGEVFLLLNNNTNADPLFDSAVPVQDGGGNLTIPSLSSPLVADWNEDGAKDLLVGDNMGTISFFENLGSNSAPVFDGRNLFNEAVQENSRFDIADWTNDGVRDIVCGSKYGQITYFEGEYGYFPDIAVMIYGGPAQAEPSELVGDWMALTVVNQGNCPVSDIVLGIYLSTDPDITLDDSALLWGVISISDELDPGEEYTVSFSPYTRIPSDAAPGLNYLGPLLDRHDEIWELDEVNNTVACPIQISPTDPVADIEANGSDIAVVVDQGESVTVEIMGNPNNSAGSNADWWVVADAASGWYHYGLAAGSFVPGLVATHQGPLVLLDPFTVFNGSYLPSGSYTFYFGVDMNMNGVPDMGQMYYDTIDVTVQ